MSSSANDFEVSAAAAHAARTLLRNFDVTEKQGGRIKATERNIAIIVDVCTGIFRAEKAMDIMLKKVPWQNKHDLANNLEMLREAISAIDIVRRQIPSYDEPGQQTVLRDLGRTVPPKMSSSESRNIMQVQNALKQAKTPDDETRVLRAAGIIR